ncbi:hypothetical protein FJ250_07800, partial [bacterium]|nr:hypothetical protein [bacterium]
MKRYLKHDRYRLEDREAESLWYAVRRDLKDQSDGARARRRAWQPALATVTVATVAVLGAWWLAGPRPAGRAPQTFEAPVVALEQQKPREAPAVAPEQQGPREKAADAARPLKPAGAPAGEGLHEVAAARPAPG